LTRWQQTWLRQQRRQQKQQPAEAAVADCVLCCAAAKAAVCGSGRGGSGVLSVAQIAILLSSQSVKQSGYRIRQQSQLQLSTVSNLISNLHRTKNRGRTKPWADMVPHSLLRGCMLWEPSSAATMGSGIALSSALPAAVVACAFCSGHPEDAPLLSCC
jgi:hypothetical protein